MARSLHALMIRVLSGFCSRLAILSKSVRLVEILGEGLAAAALAVGTVVPPLWQPPDVCLITSEPETVGEPPRCVCHMMAMVQWGSRGQLPGQGSGQSSQGVIGGAGHGECSPGWRRQGGSGRA